MANDKPKFSAGLVTVIVTLVFVALFGFFVMEGAEGGIITTYLQRYGRGTCKKRPANPKNRPAKMGYQI